ncbi:MAG: hypothetical protein H6999_11810 [Hahellaceae bacterium]|nr:hypothetical protein [Hahellaceae bacterium]MCP5170426.1 hypothetical protein [Hahellaceae bacterium]
MKAFVSASRVFLSRLISGWRGVRVFIFVGRVGLVSVGLISVGAQAQAWSFSYPQSIRQLAPNAHAAISQLTYRQFQAVQTLLDKNETVKALALLETIVSQHAANPYVVSLALRSAAELLAGNDQTGEAIDLFERVVALDSLEPSLLIPIQRQLAQLNFRAAQYGAAINAMQRWLKTADKSLPREDDFTLLAFAQYSLQRCDEAVSSAKKGLRFNARNESLWQIQLGCALQTSDYEAAAPILQRLVTIAPDNTGYWLNWSQVVQQAGQEKQALAILETLASEGRLNNEAARRPYYYLLMRQDNPARAARWLSDDLQTGRVENSLENVQLLAQAWQRAGEPERAIAALRAHPQTLQRPEVRRQLLSLLVEGEHWEALIQLAEGLYGTPEAWPLEALTASTESTWLQIASAYYHAHQTSRAQAAFRRLDQAPALSASGRGLVAQWLSYLETP